MSAARAVCILGMHRSGTSTLARAFNLLGADLGSPEGLMEPAADNPEGYWERWQIWRLHERALEVLNSSWDTPAPLPPDWQRSERVAPLGEELVALIEREFAGRPLWAWKDPRSALLLPLWRDALERLGVSLSVAFVTRNPLDVARSLHKRDGIGLEKGFGVWFNYTLCGLQGARGLPSVYLHYDRFLEDWEPELRRCALSLAIPWPADDAGLRSAMRSFVRPALRHSASGIEDLRTAGAPRQVVELFSLMTRLTADTSPEPPPDVDAQVDALAREFADYANFFREDLEAGWVARRDYQPVLERCREETERRQAAALMLLDVRRQAAEVRAELAERNAHLAGTTEQLQRAEALAAGMRRSLSWRVTRPLRWVHRRLLGG